MSTPSIPDKPNKLKILLVDDSSNLRAIVKRYLTAGGITADFSEASDGNQALELLQLAHLDQADFDVVVLDWMMPQFSGFEFLKSIRTTDTFRHNPSVVMLTAETYAEQIQACVEYEVSAYITKPFTQDDLCNAVKKAAASAQERRQKNPKLGLKHAV